MTDHPTFGPAIAAFRRWFEPDHRKEGAFAGLLMAVLLTASVPVAALNSPSEHVTNPADVFSGTGVWVDWTELNGDSPAFTEVDLDRAADQGISTLYIQVARQSGGDPIYQRDRVERLIASARQREMAVIGWHLPALDGSERDVEVAEAAQALGVDGYALDIENRSTGTAATRNAHLDSLTASLRKRLGADFPLGGIVLPPVLFEFANPNWWGGPYPFKQIANDFDATLVMSYSVDRKAPWSDSYVHMAADIAYLRALHPGVRLHMIAGYGPRFTADQAEKAARAAKEWCATGVSIYAGSDVTGDGWKRVVDNFSRSELPCRPTNCVDTAVLTIGGTAFSPGGYGLLPSADATMTEVLAAVQASKTKVVVHGHTDSSGAASENLTLSEKRATAVMQWLVTRGIEPSRLSVQAWGERCPIRSNSDQSGREANRRVDIEIK